MVSFQISQGKRHEALANSVPHFLDHVEVELGLQRVIGIFLELLLA